MTDRVLRNPNNPNINALTVYVHKDGMHLHSQTGEIAHLTNNDIRDLRVILSMI